MHMLCFFASTTNFNVTLLIYLLYKIVHKVKKQEKKQKRKIDWEPSTRAQIIRNVRKVTNSQRVRQTDCLGPLAQLLTFCQEQEREQNSVNVASATLAQPPGTLFRPTFMTLLIRVHSGNYSRMYFLIVLTTDYCWRSWTSRIAAPYKSRVDWLIDWLFSFIMLVAFDSC